MPDNEPGSRLIKAAGAVAWRPGPDGELEILLVHRRKYDDWSLPKGKAERGEQLPSTAFREVLEESGVRLALGRRLMSVSYEVGGRPKRVHYWAARALSVDERAVPNSEVDRVAWLPVDRAAEKVSYAHDRTVLADFAARPAQTVPLILLRHAKAVAKDGWAHPDATRPLDDSGRSAAEALADLLAHFSPGPRLISSTAVRCLDTVRPLAQRTGATLQEEPSLYIHGQPPATGLPAPAAPRPGVTLTALVRSAIASAEPTIICAHRENLPLLQQTALSALGIRFTVVAGADRGDVDGTGPHGTGADGAGANRAGAERAGADGAADGVRAGGPDADVGAAGVGIAVEWNDDLPTSGFWVLNVAQPPAARGDAAQGGVTQSEVAQDGAAPVGVLVSADRYDLFPAVSPIFQGGGRSGLGASQGAARPLSRQVFLFRQIYPPIAGNSCRDRKLSRTNFDSLGHLVRTRWLGAGSRRVTRQARPGSPCLPVSSRPRLRYWRPGWLTN